MLFFSILVWALTAVAVMFMAILLVPLWIDLAVSRTTTWQGSIAVRPGGRLGPRFVIPTSSKAANKTPKPKREQRHGRRFPVGAVRLVLDVLKSIHIERLALDLRFGLEDPAETGHLFGLMAPAIYGFAGVNGVNMNVEPVFDRPTLEGSVEASVSILPLQLVAPAVRFGLRTWSAGR